MNNFIILYQFIQLHKEIIKPLSQKVAMIRNSFGNSDDNEFMSVGLDNSKMAASRSVSTDQIITKLQEKNNTLKRQVNKIDRVLSTMKVEQKPRYGISLPQIKPDAIKKQLENAYKQIEIYQYEIQKRRNALTSEGAYVQQVNKIEKVYKEKIEIHQRLKREMLQVKHDSKELIKMLKNDGKKHEYQVLQSKLTTDIKYLQEKMRDYEVKRAAHISRLQAQRATIKEMEQQYLKQNSIQTLQLMKIRIFKPTSTNNTINIMDQSNIMTPSRSIIDIENDAAKQESRVSKIQSQVVIEELDERSHQAFTSLQNDTRLLKKMQGDYESKISLVTKERDQASQRNFKARNKLLEVQFEIETIEQNIAELKKMIDPSLFKPKLLKDDKKERPILAKPNKGLAINHSFKFVESGEITKTGKRFSDRALIGKVSSKIVGITLWQKQDTGEFIGLQATYKLSDEKGTIKQGAFHTRLDPKKQTLTQQTIKLEGQDYFRTIDLFTTKKNKTIVGISLVSSKNKIIKMGEVSGQRVTLKLEESQYPMCFYGSALVDGFECLGVEVGEK